MHGSRCVGNRRWQGWRRVCGPEPLSATASKWSSRVCTPKEVTTKYCLLSTLHAIPGGRPVTPTVHGRRVGRWVEGRGLAYRRCSPSGWVLSVSLRLYPVPARLEGPTNFVFTGRFDPLLRLGVRGVPLGSPGERIVEGRRKNLSYGRGR